jgi:D-alanine-D-alanine ligase-like ATP-grasp enzyme
MKKAACIYCGNNPVPHRLFWYNETLNVLLTPIRQKILYNSLTRLLRRSGRDGKVAAFFLSLGEKLKIIKRQSDILKCKVPRAKVMWEEAQKRGIEMQELLMLGYPIDTYVATKRLGVRSVSDRAERDGGERLEKQVIFSGLPRPAGYINPVLDLMDDKGFFKKIMQRNGLPTPGGGMATSFFSALKIFNNIEKPVIVKPRSGSRGRHCTTFVASEKDLKIAVKIAKQLCRWVVVEEQLFGPVYRATVINFNLEGVLRGDSPQVVGDGQSTIAQLINSKNLALHPGVKDIVIDSSAERFLSRQNFALISVLEKGKAVSLTEKIGVNYGGSSSEDFDICHPDNKELFVKAAKVLGDPLVGFDFIIPDITKSWKEQKCGFIEVNSLPFINLHHDPLLGSPRNVAAKVWDMVGM